mmetsp:Transcript_3346/g.5136  ORF Transcript_3346/g.5136 Transcript_3346/m.5136 type:complete len:129 (-) Transcript_3346:77-463(-)
MALPSAQADDQAVPPQQQTFEEAPVHTAPNPETAGDKANPKLGDKYLKIACLSFGLGEVLGEMVCGGMQECFCFRNVSACGLNGENCPSSLSSCEGRMPNAKFAEYQKLFCLKTGCDLEFAPLFVSKC